MPERTDYLLNGWLSVDVRRMGYFFENDIGGKQSSSPVIVSVIVDYGLVRKDWTRPARSWDRVGWVLSLGRYTYTCSLAV